MELHTAPGSVAGIVLAAGGSSRFGAPKQILTWQGKPLVWHVAHKALQADLSPVFVVGGALMPELEAALDDLSVTLLHNPDWQQGQSTSVRVGIKAVPPSGAGELILLADKPHIPVELIRSLKRVHATTRAPIVAPRVQGRRANPVLWDRQTFDALADLDGDVGGRVLFSRYAVEWVPWKDDWIRFDIDTPEDYQTFLDAHA
mgnify:FL=1